MVAQPRSEQPEQPMQPIILIVDDDPGIRESLSILFEDAHYPVCEARDGAEALEILQRETWPCVMLLDRMMARLDGVRTLHRFVDLPAEIRRRTSILFMTARSDPLGSTEEQFIQRVIFATVPKPFDLDTLLALVAQAGRQLMRGASDA